MDFSDFSHDTAHTAVAIASGVGAEVLFLNVVNQHLFDELRRVTGRVPALNGDLFQQAVDSTEDERVGRMKEFLAEVEAARVPHTSRVTMGIPWEKILELAESEGADLIVMGAKGHGSLLRQLRFGSSAEKIFRRATCRVMFVR